jgi:hypothetical protein
MSGIERIAAERRRQVEELGWTPEHDDEHNAGQLAMAAACYAAPERIYIRQTSANGETFADPWPWEKQWDARPHNGNVIAEPTDEQTIRLLVKAGALIAAEIDRLERARKILPIKGDAT